MTTTTQVDYFAICEKEIKRLAVELDLELARLVEATNHCQNSTKRLLESFNVCSGFYEVNTARIDRLVLRISTLRSLLGDFLVAERRHNSE